MGFIQLLDHLFSVLLDNEGFLEDLLASGSPVIEGVIDRWGLRDRVVIEVNQVGLLGECNTVHTLGEQQIKLLFNLVERAEDVILVGLYATHDLSVGLVNILNGLGGFFYVLNLLNRGSNECFVLKEISRLSMEVILVPSDLISPLLDHAFDSFRVDRVGGRGRWG